MEANEKAAEVQCSSCGARIDRCELCDEGGCGKALCYSCVTRKTAQSLPRPEKG